MLLAERIRITISEATTHGEIPIPITVSIGVALLNVADRDVQDVIERADQGLYVAKKSGRDRIFLMSEGRTTRAA